MSSYNSVTLVGNVGKEPEIRTFQSGERIASFSMATSKKWKDKTSGEYKEKTFWHPIVVKNEMTIKTIEKYVNKGTKILIEGELEPRKYTDGNGVEKHITEVVVNQYSGAMVLLGSPSGSHQAPYVTGDKTTPEVNPPAVPNDFDDEIPF